MHVAGLKMPEAYDGKCNNRNKNPCECGIPALSRVFSNLLCNVSDRRFSARMKIRSGWVFLRELKTGNYQ
jgi:hypothetical protein